MPSPATLRWALLLAQAALVLGAASNVTASFEDLSLGALDEKLQVRP